MDCQVRIATREDATTISQVVVTALRESNARDYLPEVIDQVEQSFSPDAILRLLTQRQVYVAILDHRVIATASLDHDVVRSVFVAPRHQGIGIGIGRQLMAVIESVAIDASIEVLRVPSSITAQGFYATLGFQKVRDEFMVLNARLSWNGV